VPGRGAPDRGGCGTRPPGGGRARPVAARRGEPSGWPCHPDSGPGRSGHRLSLRRRARPAEAARNAPAVEAGGRVPSLRDGGNIGPSASLRPSGAEPSHRPATDAPDRGGSGTRPPWGRAGASRRCATGGTSARHCLSAIRLRASGVSPPDPISAPVSHAPTPHALRRRARPAAAARNAPAWGVKEKARPPATGAPGRGGCGTRPPWGRAGASRRCATGGSRPGIVSLPSAAACREIPARRNPRAVHLRTNP